MPPDPSTQSVHQADPFATLALRPGWLVSRLGIAARTGLDAEVTAYSIVFWLHDALPAQDMIAWQEQKARITAEMALAGQKGAYGKLGALSSDLNRAFEDHVELSLRAARAPISARRPSRRSRTVSRPARPAACWPGAFAATTST